MPAYFLLCLFLSQLFSIVSALTYIGNVTASPSSSQWAWQNKEIGVMITFNAQTFCQSPKLPNSTKQLCQKTQFAVPKYEAMSSLTLSALDTDVWMSVAKSFGANYAVLVVDHMVGFTLWPTQQHNFSVAITQYKQGKGDIVKEYVQSCQKYGIAPGFFYSTHYNWYLGVNDYNVGYPRLYGGPTLTPTEYETIVLAQLGELAAYETTLNFQWFEVWFDGGVNTIVTPRVGPYVRTTFPDAICHSCFNFTQNKGNGNGNGMGVRWMGNEEGNMPLPSWGAIPNENTTNSFNGDPTGTAYVPPSSDTVISEHNWFWEYDYNNTLRSVCTMVNVYLTSVGRSSNLILNMAPNTTGGLDSADIALYQNMGNAIDCLWRNKIQTFSNLSLDSNGTVIVTLSSPIRSSSVNLGIVLQEDCSITGQRIGQWQMEACIVSNEDRDVETNKDTETNCVGKWVPLFFTYPSTALQGIGHKRILRAENISNYTSTTVTNLRFTAVTAYYWSPVSSSSVSSVDYDVPIVLTNVGVYDWTNIERTCVPEDNTCTLVNY